MIMKYLNPVIPGFYPDPSVCRQGNDYYIVNSSFEFFPGVPLWHSTNLCEWKQTGHVLTERSQLELDGCPSSFGVFAPTIREHNGRFYMITTNVNWFPKGTPNFYVFTDDINGKWSDPVPVAHMGIDPTLFFDDDGKVYYAGTGFDESGKQGITAFEINIEDGKILSEKKFIWYGTGGRNPEGPHLYKKDGMYYLLIAEGGTEYGHMVTCARSRHIYGPYESCPYNPILTHRDASGSIFQCAGHADLIDTPDGEWYAVFHAVRPSAAQLHHIGRETMLAKVTWKDGWPLINEGKPAETVMNAGNDEGFCAFDNSFLDHFADEKPEARWTWLRNPDMSLYEWGSGLKITGNDHTLNETASPAFMGVRQTQMHLTCETEIALSGSGTAGLCVYHTNEHHYDLRIRKEGNSLAASLYRRAADLDACTAEVKFENAEKLILRIEAARDRYIFLAGRNHENLSEIGRGSTQLLSTEVMRGTFTGCFFALFAEGNVTADFTYFRVDESAEQKEKNRISNVQEYPVSAD